MNTAAASDAFKSYLLTGRSKRSICILDMAGTSAEMQVSAFLF